MLFYAASDVAFVGGSFVQKGGHNILEPAMLGVPSLSGPSYFNFADITKMLIDADATVIVNDANHLAAEVINLFENQNLKQQRGDNSKNVVAQNQGALNKHLKIIDELLRPR